MWLVPPIAAPRIEMEEGAESDGFASRSIRELFSNRSPAISWVAPIMMLNDKMGTVEEEVIGAVHLETDRCFLRRVQVAVEGRSFS